MVFLPILLSLSFKVMLCCWLLFFFSPKIVMYQSYQHKRFAGVSVSLKNKQKQTKKPHQTRKLQVEFFSCPMSFVTERNNLSILVEVNYHLQTRIHNALSPRRFLTVHVQVDNRCSNPVLGNGPHKELNFVHHHHPVQGGWECSPT